jgi:hypothetical protein
MKLTAAAVAGLRLEPGEQDRIWFDDDVPGFGIRMRHTGARSWIYQYKLGRKTRRLVIGHATAIKPARAKEIAGELHAKVRLGGDPAAEKRSRVERTEHTFDALAQKYLAHQRQARRPSSFAATERLLEKYCAPLHRLPTVPSTSGPLPSASPRSRITLARLPVIVRAPPCPRCLHGR